MSWGQGRAAANGGAAIRAKVAANALVAADHWRAGLRGALEGRIDDDVLARLSAASPLSWFPVCDDQHIVSAIVAELGANAAQRFWRETAGWQMDSPFLRSFKDATVRLMGLSPASFVWLASHAWHQVSRGFCSPEIVTRASDRAEMRLCGIADEVLAIPEYFVCLRGVFEAFFDMAQVEGVLSFALDEGAATAEVAWVWSSARTAEPPGEQSKRKPAGGWK